MTKPVRIVASVILTAVVIQFGWFEVSNKLKTDREIEKTREQDRPLSMAAMDGYLARAESAKRQEIAVHKGEPSPGGLQIGMTPSDALKVLPGGEKDRTYPDVMRFPLPSQKGQEVIGKFIDSALYFSVVAKAGTDAFGIDLAKRYGTSSASYGGR